MTIYHETHNQQQGQGSAETAQGSRHEYLQRQIRRETPFAPGQDGNVRRRIRRKTRIRKSNVLQLGVWNSDSNSRNVSQTCRSLRYFGTYSDTERVSHRLSSTVFTSIFQASGKFATSHVPIFVEWRKFPKIHVPEFQESNVFSKRNFDNILNLTTLLIDISSIWGYTVSRDTNHRESVHLFPALARSRSFVSQQKLQTARAGFFTLTREENRI